MLGLVMDTGAPERRVFDQVHETSYRFLGRVLRSEGRLEQRDRTFVMLKARCESRRS